ncbi:hypothetical protein CONCODRAFT_167183 [Conidiobolus coronatus NRRL 28638]|uniref:Uncharacterized protein n=1 Tax=Conidiobolus coronatus (strain ATCC 28846 / CBS 209.66 / NRRL 28638) TaxID=796925 RepID=A0A137PEK3_CONC2|nr:hypothetical protein CONCODRAFT_167183 [Conidiobolus coronatus NRRL 28638]|eukprot:KXN73436.1 hypothetical protein CONCODRAFT_167183 [Conidiobolus coronatus NRRL 28638]
MNLLLIASIVPSILAAPLVVSALNPEMTSVKNVNYSGGSGPYNTPSFNVQIGSGPFFASWNQPFSPLGGGPGGFGAGARFRGPGEYGIGAGFGGPGGFGVGAGF